MKRSGWLRSEGHQQPTHPVPDADILRPERRRDSPAATVGEGRPPGGRQGLCALSTAQPWEGGGPASKEPGEGLRLTRSCLVLRAAPCVASLGWAFWMLSQKVSCTLRRHSELAVPQQLPATVLGRKDLSNFLQKIK